MFSPNIGALDIVGTYVQDLIRFGEKQSLSASIVEFAPSMKDEAGTPAKELAGDG